MAQRKIRIGILGTALIANKFMAGQKSLGSCEVVSIASRTQERATVFATKWGIPKTYCTYDLLVNDPSIDLVYIPLPTTLHKEWTIKSAQKGKHVICEKPLAPNYEDVLEMVKECQKNNVQFMDGTYWTHSQRTKILQQHLNETGGVRTVASKFTWILPPDNIRQDFSTEPLGALGDLGWYCARATLFGFNYELPEKLFGIAHAISTTVPNFSFSAILWYSDGRSAHFDCTFGEATRQWVEFSGKDASVRVDDFVVPWNSRVSFLEQAEPEPENTNFTVIKYPGKSRQVVVNEKLSQEQQMIEDMCEIILSGKLNPFWVEVALKTHLLLVLLMKSAADGVPVSVPKNWEFK